MKSTELRIGNLLSWDGEVHDWEAEDFASPSLLKYAQPIPLTEEWLVKFGFYFDGVRYQKEINNNLWVFVKNNFYGWYCPHIEVSNGIKYVHLLQNLMFALTGEELKINDSL